MHGTIQNISTSGAPTIDFRFAGDTCTADLAGAHLYAEGGRPDGGCDLRITDAQGFVLANLVVNERPERNMTENLMDIGSALLWSHWRYIQSLPPMSEQSEKHTDSQQESATAE
jgi:hypothetical protein